ncbi:uncharacterized protein A4U43_C07F7930 [Asparagus officinalis]|uniref:Pentacotripeptide-repeat region of PRORP domain-containing protein n=1 Tax=Asparagus officinalis TaxID=4686 RepID=A0A5P1EC41_ASPOF|nr:uncharacterized protein A4U43_C07F7930 [Asparagus officinalis]
MLARCISLRFLSSSNLPAHLPAATPDFISLLTRCSTFNHVTQTHAFAIPRGLDRDNLLLSKFISACSLLGFRDYAYSIFRHQQQPNVYLFNTVIKILSQSESARGAIVLFKEIQQVGLRPDTYSFPFVLRAVASLSSLELGKQIHSQILRHGLSSDIHVSTGLVHMYSNCGSVDDARVVFDGTTHRDVVLWNAMVAGYARVGDVDGACGLFDRMHERNVVSWTTVIAGYSQMNRPDEAIGVFRRMQVEDSIEPDEIALLAVLSACAQLGALDLGEWIHGFIDRKRLYKIVPLMNALIDMYAKSGNIEKALEVFENMKNKSVVTWTTMIAGFALHGLGNEALDMFNRMEKESVKPNDVTFLAILSACSHIGQTNLGKWYFERMSSHYHIKPKIEHYGCMVDLLGRAGCLIEAHALIKEMPFEANAAIWGALLASARMRGDVEMGELALRHLVEVEPHNSANYTLLSNIYAAYE